MTHFRLLAALFITLAVGPLRAWGPHPEIVDAAVAVLSTQDQAQLIATLGDDARRLRFLVWMGDFGNQYVSWNETWNGGSQARALVQFYANDYLIFPAAPRLYKHECPDVMNTFTPFFRRSLQAAQTETPGNAARWIGALLHFTTDTGAPPHAAGLSGDIHSKMENWINGSAISIAGYQPRLLGENADDAVDSFERRMAGLIEFSKLRAERLYPFISAGDRPGAEPIVLESADETARVTADLLHTLLFLASRQPDLPPNRKERGELEASVTAPSIDEFRNIPAKLMLRDSLYSTASEFVTANEGEYRGVFLLRNLPPGSYRGIVSRIGARTLFLDNIVIKPRSRTHLDWRLDADEPAGNLIRNPDFRIHWASANPDNWQLDAALGSWVSDNVKVHGGGKYRLEVWRRNELEAPVRLRWYKNHWQAAADDILLPPAAGGRESMDLTAPDNAQYVRLLIGASEEPGRAVKSIALIQTR